MGLVQEVQAAFGPAGVLSRTTEYFVPRAGQTEMAVAVAQAVEGGYALVVEASTGVGKTFSYLVPALLSGERVLLSTATKALQDQLFGRDLPQLARALGIPVSVALLKGRASYLCLHRMEMARQEPALPSGASLSALAYVEKWSQSTRTGDVAELAGVDEKSPLIPLITSTRDNCLGAPCPRFRSCHVNLARREAMAADIVVINHHLFFADLAVRESGVAELLPSARIVIFDEAHQLNETGIQFLGRHLTTAQLLDFARDVLAAGLQGARGLVDWQFIVGGVENAARELRMCVGRQHPGAKLRWNEQTPDGVDGGSWITALQSVHAACLAAGEALDTLSEISPDFVRLHERAVSLAERSDGFISAREAGSVRWVDVGSQLRLVESPLDISHAVKTRLLDVDNDATPDRKSWIFTSATLGDDDQLSWFTQPCGLTQATLLKVGSPFNYAEQAALYVPPSLPRPGDPGHSEQLARSAARWASHLGGRTLILTTTLRALRVIGETLRIALDALQSDLDVLVQGERPKRELIEQFRAGANGARPCVLVASASFWEGIDVPGDALQMVIIDKLPFPPPNDPLAEARSKMLESQGRNAFSDYFLPEAAVALKQGAGRLIRRETDRGVLIVADTRLTSMGYGKRLLKALPPMQRITTEIELLDRLTELTKTYTRDCQAI